MGIVMNSERWTSEWTARDIVVSEVESYFIIIVWSENIFIIIMYLYMSNVWYPLFEFYDTNTFIGNNVF